MKRTLIILSLTFSINCLSQTQAEMNKEAYRTYKKADKELNSVYKNILTEYKADAIFVENLKKSQRIWIEFRDAELEMKYPKRKPGFYGTIHPICRAMFLEELTETRTKTLRLWLKGIESLEACNGSIKLKKSQ